MYNISTTSRKNVFLAPPISLTYAYVYILVTIALWVDMDGHMTDAKNV